MVKVVKTSFNFLTVSLLITDSVSDKVDDERLQCYECQSHITGTCGKKFDPALTIVKKCCPGVQTCQMRYYDGVGKFPANCIRILNGNLLSYSLT